MAMSEERPKAIVDQYSVIRTVWEVVHGESGEWLDCVSQKKTRHGIDIGDSRSIQPCFVVF